MKVLLQKDVKGTGKAGDVINAADGFARNFLIPKGLAIPADADNIHSANLKKDAERHRMEVQRQQAKELAAGMNGKTVKVYAKAGENGKLFGSIGAQEIADALKAQYDIAVDKKKIRLAEPIKSLGTVEVGAHMFENASAKFKVEVMALEN